MKFFLDAQLSPRLAERLIEAGHSAMHVSDVLTANATDLEICEEANKRGAILVTKDEDFVDLSARDVLQVPLLWLRIGNMTTRAVWAKLEPLLPSIKEAFEAGERIVEVR